MNRRLMLSCSATKQRAPHILPASERYIGVAYRVLRRYRCNQPDPSLHVLILSARYGLITAQKPIPWYDQAMTPERALVLQPRIQQRLSCALQCFGPYHATCIHLGRTYLPALARTPALELQLGTITFTSGGIGVRLGQLKRWLYGH